MSFLRKLESLLCSGLSPLRKGDSEQSEQGVSYEPMSTPCRKRRSPLRKGDRKSWIPAFAGMTKYTSSHVERVPHFPRFAT